MARLVKKCSKTCRACNVEGYESDSIEFLKTFAVSEPVFLDIGSHVGLFCLALAERAGTTYAIEPFPAHFKDLRENIELSGYKNIIPIKSAVWDHNNGVSLKEKLPGQHYCLEEPGDVRSITVDEILSREIFTDRLLIKIDVEGGELKVLYGAEETLSRYKEVALVIEVGRNHLTRTGQKPEELYEFLEGLGFYLYKMPNEYKNRNLFKAHFLKRGDVK